MQQVQENNSRSFGIPQIKEWTSLAEQSLHNQKQMTVSEDINSVQFINRTGIKSAQAFTVYLNSTGGKTEHAIILRKYEQLLELEKASRQEALAEATREKIMLGFLLASILYEREARTDWLNRLLSAGIDKQLSILKEQIKKNQIKDVGTEELMRQAMLKAYQEQIAFYDKALVAVNQALQQINQQIQTVTAQLAAISQQLTVVNQNIQAIVSIQQRIQNHISHIQTLHPQNTVGRRIAIQDLLTLFRQQSQELEQKITLAQSPLEIEQYLNEKQEIDSLINEGEHWLRNEAQENVYLHQGQQVNDYQVDAYAIPKSEYEKFIKQHKASYVIVNDHETQETYVLYPEENLHELKNTPQGRERLQQAKEIFQNFVNPWMSDLQKRSYDLHDLKNNLQQNISELKEILNFAHQQKDLLENKKSQLENDRRDCQQEYDNLDQQKPQKSNVQAVYKTPTPLSMRPTPGSSTRTMLSILSPDVLHALRDPKMKADILRVSGKSSLRDNLNKLEGLSNNTLISNELADDLAKDLSEVKENIRDVTSPWYNLLNPLNPFKM